MDNSDSFSEKDRLEILASIKEAEKNTSGEIRLFIEDECGENVLDRAAFIFNEIRMNKTKEHNGVLFYLAMKSHQFAIIGDKGINRKVDKDFWHAIKLEMQNHFTEGDFVKGLNKGIRMTGEALKAYFPHEKSDKNELSDDIIFRNKGNKHGHHGDKHDHKK
jgi:uncharacterized membrane protein